MEKTHVLERITKKAKNIPSFIVMDVLERAHVLEREGRDIIHLEIGEPDFPTPSCICEAAVEAIHRGETHYTHSLGLLELREAICEKYLEWYGVTVNPDRIVVTSGTSPALFMIFSALLEAGDEIILSDPHYPCYPNFAEFIGAKPVFVDTLEEEGFQLRAEKVAEKIGPRTRAVMINSPSNPTGNLLAPEEMARIADLGLPVISDEIYHGLVYGRKAHSALEYSDNVFVLNGFSKLYAMTGWRLGFLIAPEPAIRPLQKVQQNFFISAGSISQWAGVAALKEAEEDVARMRETYDERRRYMIGRLRELGFGLPVEPAGAFYMLVNAKHLSPNSYELAFEMLEKAGVGVSPGIDFGKNAEGYLRFSYANSIEKIREGLDRIEEFLTNRSTVIG
ncbi:MAG: pyridoxal phosphate-dependent aminotransferase [Deltaproteobacteria bacterium]|nr:pyridoxal phosphate-dependent aminotransferase [Deltaproteobacteria bacterium]MBW1950129.1 pyridoxal phosphate-dependent aminotransferase [Deltaproteobacteria bacterium]MBW2007042.1 pyridoxal phosphate-dependent aminotransferase [Deltaproteobacteria bacterium]MBW2348275.1 pyridoxal phosphate-dependent aminotransferase [Deltaproteobacteria bacterium]RLB39802.1 MAG: pyridoxal phosphate-dependent aminotransferase [Deltaproteobacteria bacterium]